MSATCGGIQLCLTLADLLFGCSRTGSPTVLLQFARQSLLYEFSRGNQVDGSPHAIQYESYYKSKKTVQRKSVVFDIGNQQMMKI